MEFTFHARFVDVDEPCLRLSFAETVDASGEHYFLIDRSEGSPDEPVPNIQNVYIERDDQGWGGFGDIDRIALTKTSLSVHLGNRMATRVGGYSSIRVTFDLTDEQFQGMRKVLRLIMTGYESRLAC
jgi:hypothetical protein